MAAQVRDLGRTPRVFVSSTIADLQDLRSAIKHYLEETGFEVILSEFPTFPHAIDKAARLAAIPAIEDCDYFVLIIGERCGTVLEDGVSVTRTEYRRARQLAGEGRLKLITLARQTVFDLWHRHLELVPDLPDWPAIRSFLDEVNEEHPAVSNWIHRFASFRDVTDVLRAQLRSDRPLRRRALEANLLWEVRENIKACYYARREHPAQAIPNVFSSETVPEYAEGDERGHGDIILTNRQAEFLTWFWMLAPSGARGLRRKALDDAVASGDFLEFDTASATFRVGEVQARLMDLGDRIGQFELAYQTRFADPSLARAIAEVGAAARHGAVGGVTVSPITLRTSFVLRNQLWNILASCATLGRFLAGVVATLEQPAIVPLFPPPTQESPENDRQMTDAEVDQFLRTASG